MGGSRTMIRYKHKLSFNTSRNGELYIETDMGQTWKCLEVNDSSPMTAWIAKSAQTELQHWQKDIAKVVVDAFVDQLPDFGSSSYTLYHVYQKGQGYRSTSDVMLMRIPSRNIWFISTEKNTWMIENKFDNFTLFTSDALGSILEKTVRTTLYDFSDSQRGIKQSSIKYTDADYVAKGIAP